MQYDICVMVYNSKKYPCRMDKMVDNYVENVYYSSFLQYFIEKHLIKSKKYTDKLKMIKKLGWSKIDVKICKPK